MMAKRSEDFRDWDIEVETSYSGYDQLGFPFYIWREKADSRLGLGRPRYCCVTEQNNELHFTFFNPSEDIRSTGTATVFQVAAGLMALITIGSGWIERQNARGLDYIHDTSSPPLMILIGAFIFAMFAGMFASTLWYIVITLYRWINGRFKGDGRIDVMPINMLEGFQVINAGDAGAEINGKRATIGHGLTACFADGSQLILTGNAWNYESIAATHRIMTSMFCTCRREFVTPWAEQIKQAAEQSGSGQSRSSVSKNGIPEKL